MGKLKEMVMNQDQQRSNVRFEDHEYKQILEDALRAKKSIPALLKEAYFKRDALSAFRSDELLKQIRTELSRIGNNVNQIARQLNSGLREGFNTHLESIQSDIAQMVRTLEKARHGNG